MKEPRRKPGRPGREPAPGERVGLSLRVTPQTKRALDAAAESQGRSLSQEAEVRLERSFQAEDLLPQLLEAAFGRQQAGLLLILGRVMRDAGFYSGAKLGQPFIEGGNWFGNHAAYIQANEAARRVMDALAPPANTEAPTAAEAEIAGLGRMFASGALEALVGVERTTEIGTWAARIRGLLGPALDRIPKDFQVVAVPLSSPKPGGDLAGFARIGLTKE